MDPERCQSIDAYVTEANLSNTAAAIQLNAAANGWGSHQFSKDLILLINLTHLITAPELKTLISEAAIALSDTGAFIIYGPFRRAGKLTSEGDARFDSELRSADSDIGYKDDLDILHMLSNAGLTEIKTIDMPANNLAFIARKP
jgi:hypothetical protein